MAKLPYSRVVRVDLTRTDAWPSRRGFGVPLFLTTQTVTGVLDATKRTKVYGSMPEVSVDFAATDEFYKAANEAFGQNPRPMQLKVGFVAANPTTGTAANLKADMDAIEAYDDEWYWIGIDKVLRDKAMLDGLVEWTEARHKLNVLDSNDPLMESAADTTNIAARHKGTVERTAIFYHTDPNEYGGFAFAAMLGTRNFDNSDSAYTAKFKRIRLLNPINKGSAAVQAATGFTPQLGQSNVAGHMANTFVDIGGRFFTTEGSTLTANVFIDVIHATDWIILRTEEETLGILLNNERIPYTDAGLQTLASGPRIVMRMAARAGLIANDINEETGQYEPAVTYEIPSVFDVPESQRVARIAPNIRVNFRYSGAVHYAQIDYTMRF